MKLRLPPSLTAPSARPRRALVWIALPPAPAIAGSVRPAAAATLAPAGDWRQPGFDAGHTKFNPEPSDLTPFHVRHLQRVWSHHSPFFVPAAPAVVGNRLFIAGRNEDDSGAISELDASTGRLRWTRSQSCAAGPLSVVQDVLVVGDDCPTVAVG